MKYITAKGETLDMIAYNAYENEELIAPIIEANPEHAETVCFEYGVALEIPDIKTVDDSAFLPPWRR